MDGVIWVAKPGTVHGSVYVKQCVYNWTKGKIHRCVMLAEVREGLTWMN